LPGKVQAITYLLNQRKPLSVCLSEPRIPIHNNDTERDVRHPVLGRKNYLIFASPKGGEVAARLYSLVLSARLIALNVQDYIEDACDAARRTPSSTPPD
jgi:transposase